VAGPFEDFIKSQTPAKSQPKQAGSFADFMAAEESNAALPVGAEKTGLPGVPLRLPQVDQQGLPGTVASGAAETFDSFMRGGAQAVNSSIRGVGGGVQAVDRAVQSLNPLNPTREPSLVALAGQKLVEFADQQQRTDASAKPAYAKALEQKQADILDHPELLKEPAFWANMGGNVVGSMIAMLPAGMGAASKADKVAYLSGRFAPAVRAAAGPGAAAFVETFMDAGNTYQDAIDKGHSPEMAGRVAAEVFAREFPTTVAFDAAGLFNDNIKGGIRKAVVSALTEGGQEAAQGLAQRTAERDILGDQQSIWGPVPLELLSGLMGGPVGSVMLGGGGRKAEAGSPVSPQLPQVAEDVAAQSGLETPGVRPGSPSTQVETIPAAPETISAIRETKGSSRDTIPAKVETQAANDPKVETFADFMARDEKSQRAIADADTMLADIEPEAFEAGRRAKDNEGNPFDGLDETDARIRAAAFEAGRKAAVVVEVQTDEAGPVQEEGSAAAAVDRGIDPVPVLPEAAGAGVSGPERTGDARQLDGVPAVQPGDGNPATASAEAVAPSNPVEKQEISTAKSVIQQKTEAAKQNLPKTREFAKAVKQHGRWETILRKAIADGNTKLETAAARMVDKYGAGIRDQVPGVPVMANEIREAVTAKDPAFYREAARIEERGKQRAAVERNSMRAQVEVSKINDKPRDRKKVEAQQQPAAAASAKPAARKRPGRTVAPGSVADSGAPKQAAQSATPVDAGGLTAKPASSFAETSLDERRMTSGAATGGKSAAIRAKNERRIDAWVLDAIRTAEPQGGNLITRKLREALPGVSKEALDHSVGRLYRAEKILVDRHSGPMMLSEKERDELVYDNLTKARYVTARLNVERETAAAKQDDALDEIATGKVKPVSQKRRKTERGAVKIGDVNNAEKQRVRDAIASSNYQIYGLRMVSEDDPIAEGTTAEPSFRWDDGQQLDDVLDGTSAIAIGGYDEEITDEQIARAFKLVRDYPGKRLAVLGAENGQGGEDRGEVVMKDAQVLKVFPASWKSGESGRISLDLLTGGRAETLIKVIETGKARAADAYSYLVKPLAVRIADEGNGSGKDLVKLLRTARDRGEVAAGQLLAQLDDVKLSALSKEERLELTDALEGRKAPTTPKIKDAFERTRELTDAVAKVAVDLRLQVKGGPGQKRRDFVPRANYLPHIIRPVAALKRGRVREDVIANVAHINAAPDAKAAERMLDEYIEYVESGKKLDKVLDYLVSTGQAPDRATALARMERFKSQVKREGSLEYSREVNLPFYDPDPARVLAPHLASQAIRLTQIALFGQDDQRINAEILKMREAGANTKMVREAVDRILGRTQEGDDAAARVSRLLRSIQTAKLGLAVIPNSFQGTMNSLVAADLPSVMLGWKATLSKEGRRFAIESGAAIEPVLSEAHREFGGSELMSKYLNATGFSATEQLNRVLAANTGKIYLGKLFEAARNGDKRGSRLLREFIGIEAADAALRGGKLRDRDILLGAKRFSDLTQFRSRPEDLPGFASTNMGKVFFQFKSFAYNQTKLMHGETVTAFKNGEVNRGLRTVFLLATLFPLQGEIVRLLREMLRGAEPKEYETAWAHYWDSLAASSALGVLGDVLQTTGKKRGLEFLAGPTLSTGGDSINLMGTLVDDNASDEAKSKAVVKYLRRHLPLGQLWGRLLED
jgi:hypothetical protein